MQSEHYKGFDIESHQWLKCNIDARKVSAIYQHEGKNDRNKRVESKQRDDCDHRKLQIM